MLPSENRKGAGEPGNRLRNARNRRRALLWLLLAGALLFWVWGPLSQGMDGREEISYTAFREHLEADRIERVTVQGQEVRGTLRPGATERVGDDGRQFVTHVPSFGTEGLLTALEDAGVEVQAEPASDTSMWIVLLNLAPFALLLLLGWWFFRRAQSQGRNLLGMGRSRAKPYDRESVDTRFDDVAGLAGPKRELREIIEFLKDPGRFHRLGGEIPRGVLLVGPPGTGKTLLARAVAGEADAPFFSVTGSDFMEMLVGVGASRVRDLFREAKKASPSILFIDELDSIGRRRGAGLGGGHDEREQTLNQLLSEMDGFEPNHSVVVMAATNRPDILDPALLRPGRFDRRITVGRPTMEDRLHILRIHARDKPLGPDVELERVARSTPGFSGADLENLLNEAALLAAREDKDAIGRQDIDRARDKILMGLERTSLALTDEEKRSLAYHEGGHALLAAVLPHADPIHKVTIIPRGRAMGVTQQLPERDKYLYDRDYLLDRLAVMMGGRAAEELAFDQRTSGAEQDLKEATRLARKMVLDWGMHEELGALALGGRREQVFLGEEIAHRREYSEETAREVDQAVRSLVDDAYARALRTLHERREDLDRLAEALLEEEEVPRDRVLDILGLDAEEAEPDPPVAASDGVGADRPSPDGTGGQGARPDARHAPGADGSGRDRVEKEGVEPGA